MSLNVKTRIAIVMTAVLLVSVAGGAVAWYLSDQAARNAEAARDAAARAEWAARFSAISTELMSESNDLALGVGGDSTAESSAEYGDVVGADQSAALLLKRAPGIIGEELATGLADEWELLRTRVYAWVNAEAAEEGWPTRMTLMDDGRVRASVGTNIATPTDLVGLNNNEVRRQVRSEFEAFRDRRLRDISRAANAEATAAGAAEAQARQLAERVTLGMLALGALVALIGAVWLYRTIAVPLAGAHDVARRVSEGEFDARFATHRADEIGDLVHAVEEMRDTVVSKVAIMREMAGAVLVIAEGVSRSAAEARSLVSETAGANGAGAALDDVAAQAAVLTDLSGQMLSD
ncbi:MAG: HAMP domain-containing protein [Coriobacteriia bacterium]|nr:HAMP domain-containing protein [Coriobacteriia bacterium]